MCAGKAAKIDVVTEKRSFPHIRRRSRILLTKEFRMRLRLNVLKD